MKAYEIPIITGISDTTQGTDSSIDFFYAMARNMLQESEAIITNQLQHFAKNLIYHAITASYKSEQSINSAIAFESNNVHATDIPQDPTLPQEIDHGHTSKTI